jgi:serine/threonine protein kinase
MTEVPAARRYSVLFPLASGGMGTVSLAVQRGGGGFSRLVAIKQAHAHLLTERTLRKSLVEEARIAAAIRHANVVAVLDVEEHAGDVSLMMEYVEGASLSELQASSHRLSPAVAGRIIVDVARGLHAAHETADLAGNALGIVHRDVSPQNILVGIDGIARISDFGVAKASRAASLTTSDPGTVKGKRAYCAPEYLETGGSERRLDVFSLGVVAWEAFVGQRLFREPVQGLPPTSARHGGVTPPSAVNASLPRGLDDVLLRALAQEPEQRYQTVFQFSEALQRVLEAHGLLAGCDEVGRHVVAAVGSVLAERRRVLRNLMAARDVDLPAGRLPDELTSEYVLSHQPQSDARPASYDQPQASSQQPKAGARFVERRLWRVLGLVATLLIAGAVGGAWLRPNDERGRAAAVMASAPMPKVSANLLTQGALAPSAGSPAHSLPEASAAAPGMLTQPPLPPPVSARRSRTRSPIAPLDKAPPNPYR